MDTDLPQSLFALLAELESAVLRCDRLRSEELARVILQRLVLEQNAGENMQRQVKNLLQSLEPTVEGANYSDELAMGIEGIDQMPTRASASIEDGSVFPVWFATNRVVVHGSEFSDRGRAPDTTLGRVHVHIPKAHLFGETGNGFLRRLFRRDLRNDRLQIQDIEVLKEETFYDEVRALLEASRIEGTPEALLFLHGFRVSFEEAAIRAAQIGCDLRVNGPTAFFSWPSRGRIAGYLADSATIEASERAITRFLVDFALACKDTKVHVIAHSMGNRGLLRALQRISGNAETRGKIKLGQIFLAAPDVDRDLFMELAALYSEFSERTTLYSSDSDLPVHLSSRLHDSPRAGYHRPYTVVDGVDTIAVPDFDIDALGHSYFAQAEALLYDIHNLIRSGQAPGKRPRLTPVKIDEQQFWQLGR